MSIASEITRLQGVKSDILTAIGNKGVTVPVGSALDDCPGLIGEIPSGGGTGDIYYDSIEAIADGYYKCVRVGNKLWMNEFLQQPAFKLITPYGALYQYDTFFNNDGTMNTIFTDRPNTTGWRLPTRAELNSLFTDLDATCDDFKSKYGWYNGNNGTGLKKMSFFPIGLSQSYSVNYDYISKYSYFWTSDVISSSDAHAIGLRHDSHGTSFSSGAGTNKSFYFGIRLVKDIT